MGQLGHMRSEKMPAATSTALPSPPPPPLDLESIAAEWVALEAAAVADANAAGEAAAAAAAVDAKEAGKAAAAAAAAGGGGGTDDGEGGGDDAWPFADFSLLPIEGEETAAASTTTAARTNVAADRRAVKGERRRRAKELAERAAGRGTGAAVVRLRTRPGAVISDTTRDGKAMLPVDPGGYLGMESQGTHMTAPRFERDQPADDSAAAEGRGEEEGGGHVSESVQAKEQRHSVFAAWLVRTYGLEVLSTGAGVLDVGGGKGGVCAALGEMGIPTVLLEPCPRDTTGSGVSEGEGAGEDAAVDGDKAPRFEMIVASLEGDGSSLLVEGDVSDAHADAVRTDALLRSVSMVVGMHSDQATGK